MDERRKISFPRRQTLARKKRSLQKKKKTPILRGRLFFCFPVALYNDDLNYSRRQTREKVHRNRSRRNKKKNILLDECALPPIHKNKPFLQAQRVRRGRGADGSRQQRRSVDVPRKSQLAVGRSPAADDDDDLRTEQVTREPLFLGRRISRNRYNQNELFLFFRVELRNTIVARGSRRRTAAVPGAPEVSVGWSPPTRRTRDSVKHFR